MTVIAGVSLFNGVMLLSDCRATIKRPGKKDVHCDNAQKLFSLTPTAVLGFSGDVATAAVLLRELLRQLPKRNRRDSASLVQCVPRFLRSGVATLRARKKRVGHVDFMLTASFPTGPT